MSPDPRHCSWEVSWSNLIDGDTQQPWTLSEQGIPSLQDAHDFQDIGTALRFSFVPGWSSLFPPHRQGLFPSPICRLPAKSGYGRMCFDEMKTSGRCSLVDSLEEVTLKKKMGHVGKKECFRLNLPPACQPPPLLL